MEHELDEDGRVAVVRSFTAGVLRSYNVYNYTTWRELIEVVSDIAIASPPSAMELENNLRDLCTLVLT